MASRIYSKAVLIGLQNEGFSFADVAAMTGQTVAKVKSISQAKSSLTDGNLAAIEHATGLTGGQLAMKSEASPNRVLSRLMDALADVRDHKSATTHK